MSITPHCPESTNSCSSDTCYNGGVCREGWNRVMCDCSNTEYAGATCTRGMPDAVVNIIIIVIITLTHLNVKHPKCGARTIRNIAEPLGPTIADKVFQSNVSPEFIIYFENIRVQTYYIRTRSCLHCARHLVTIAHVTSAYQAIPRSVRGFRVGVRTLNDFVLIFY